MPVAWSLEVEVQFYILAPLFCLLFLLRQAWIRRLICLVVIVASALYWFNTWIVSNVFMYLHYFFSGILLADLYASRKVLFNQRTGAIIGLLALAGYIFLPSMYQLWGYVLKITCIFLLVHTVLTNEMMKKIFSVPGLVVIGGMCYSIYLLHFAVISFVGELLAKSGMDTANRNYFIPIMLLFALAVLLVSAVYFLLVEKPFMKPFAWNKSRDHQ
jgi:peptidoglycan/LPS O-acetylase OafA/YrhL